MAEIKIIPFPSNVVPRPGWFRLDAATRLAANQENQQNAKSLRDLLSPATGFYFPAGDPAASETNTILLELSPEEGYTAEAYSISITPEYIRLSAGSPTGIFYAIQSLRQMLPVEIESDRPVSGVEWKLPCAEINDQPRWRWRGYMLDEARHFQGIETVKKLLDQMALLKLNRFHWHLTDDQGWRIEIRQYPRLTEVGSHRPGTVSGNPFLSRKHDNKPHYGFYSQEEIREVVRYAAERQIMVIPEIEMPGHSSAALAAYPEYSCTGGPIKVETRFGIFPEIYCAGKPATYAFLENVLAEVTDLFPGPYVHIGGDEAPKRRWRRCPDCQARIHAEGLKDEHALQVYLTNHIAKFLAGLGKRAIFWSDSFDPEIDPNAIVQYWIGHKRQVLDSVRQGREMILSPYLSTYLDHTYATLPLKKAFRFDRDFQRITASMDGILGFEGLMWGEWLPNYRRVEYQTFPRLAALAETGWRRDRLPYPDFENRLKHYLRRLEVMDIGYAKLSQAQPPWHRNLLKYIDIALPKNGISKPANQEN